MASTLKPPPTLDCCRVLEYAILDKSVRYSGHSHLYAGETEVGPVPRLAICEENIEGKKRSGVLLLHCGHDWTSIGCAAYASVQEARQSAEQSYPGVSALWVDAHVSEEEAAHHLQELWKPMSCRLCGKMPFQTNERFIERDGSFICESCIRASHELLREDKQ